MEWDPHLKPFEDNFHLRYNKYVEWKNTLTHGDGDLVDFAKRSYEKHAFHIDPETKDIVYTEWLPNAEEVYVTGDFNEWNNFEYPMEKGEFGRWVITLPAKKDKNGNPTPLIPHNTKYKVFIKLQNGE